MRRKSIILIASLTVIIVGLCFIYKFNHSDSGLKNASQFSSFPIGKEVNIDINFTASLNEEYTDREKKDQAKDWLLYTVLADANLSSDAVNEITYDLPITRHGYNRNVFNLDYGETRSRYIGDGNVIAIIPACSGSQEIDYLSHIVDEQRKNQGNIPEALHVFEYKIDLPNSRASLIQINAPEVKKLFTLANGYYEQSVTSLNDLKRVLEQIQDVTYASNKNGTLVIGGRKLKAHNYKSIQLEDIAAIWQSERDIQRKKDEFEQKWSNRTYTTEAEEEMMKEREDLQIVNGSGFSLDPVFNYDQLIIYFSKYEYELSQYVNINDLTKAEDDLKDNNAQPLLNIISELEEDRSSAIKNRVGKYLEEFVFANQVQKARYDGELKGTEVGMHLFYTDLLAKLWCVNFISSSPNKLIEGFVNDPETDSSLPKIYTKEASRFPSARLWFGPNPLGYQIADEKTQLFFARNATKIYSASSNPLNPGAEVKTSAIFDASTDWWNNHYEEVAQYEQEYETLNEIMKWSTIIGWLNANNAQSLNFLSDTKVERGYWFSDWVSNQHNLKFNQWNKINFFKKGYKGFDTETLPILSSAEYYDNYSPGLGSIQGGVSLAEKSAIEKIEALPKTTNELIRRSNLDYTLVGDELKTVNGNTFKLINEGQTFKVISKAENDAILRSRFEEVSNKSFEKDLFKSPQELSVKVNFNGTNLGDLDVTRTKNGFAVGFQSRDIDKGQSLAKKISNALDPISFLQASDDVETYMKLPGKEEYLIKQKESSKWMHLEIEDEPEVALSSQWDSRVSGNIEESKVCNLKWVDERDVLNIKGGNRFALTADGRLELQTISASDQSSFIPFTLNKANKNIKAYFNPETSEIYFDESITRDNNFQITSLEDLLSKDDLIKIRQRAASGKEFNYTINNEYSLENDLLHSYSNNDYKGFLDQLDNAGDINNIKKTLRIEKIKDLKQLDAELDPYNYQLLLDKLNKKYGSIPELKFRNGLTKLESADYKVGESLINETLDRVKNGGQLYDEVNNLIKSSSMLSYESKNVLLNITDYKAGKATFIQAAFEQVPNGTKVPISSVAEEMRKGNAFAFIQSNPSLNNVDWNVAIDPSILSSMSNPVCIRLKPQSLGSYDMQVVIHPAITNDGRISYNVNAVARFRPVTNQNNGNDDSTGTTLQIPNAAISNKNNGGENGNKKKQNDEKIQYYIYFPEQEKGLLNI